MNEEASDVEPLLDIAEDTAFIAPRLLGEALLVTDTDEAGADGASGIELLIEEWLLDVGRGEAFAFSLLDDDVDDTSDAAFNCILPEPLGAALFDTADDSALEVELLTDWMVLNTDEAETTTESLADGLILDVDEAGPLEDTPLGSELLDTDDKAGPLDTDGDELADCESPSGVDAAPRIDELLTTDEEKELECELVPDADRGAATGEGPETEVLAIDEEIAFAFELPLRTVEGAP